MDPEDKAKNRRIEVILAPNLDSLFELISIDDCGVRARLKAKSPHEVAFSWLPHQDSNLEKRYQKPVCYHYTMGHSV